MKVALSPARWLPPHLAASSGDVRIVQFSEQILVTRPCSCAEGKPPAQLEAPGCKVGLQPESAAGVCVLLPGGARDGRHYPPGHRLQRSLLAQVEST